MTDPGARLDARRRLERLILTMRDAADKWDYDQHSEVSVRVWADELESLLAGGRRRPRGATGEI